MFPRFAPVCLTLLLLAGCGGLPRPFEGYPGANATRLVQPPPVRLVVMRPDAALLTSEAAAAYGAALAEALVGQDMPAVAARPSPGDWRLSVSAETTLGQVTPEFTVFDPIGNQVGIAQGRAVSAEAWSTASPATLRDSAQAAAPNIASLMTRIEAARRANDPNSLVNRPIKVQVAAVTGAPGDGNRQLTRNMGDQLAQFGMQVQDSPVGADYIVAGTVLATSKTPKTTQIEIQWQVRNAQADERGKLWQLNEVPAGSLDRYWGDVAVAAASEAAAGVKDVLDRDTGRTTRPAAQP